MTMERTVFLSKTDMARRHIEKLIITRAVKPGDRITTREVAEAIGISETPIREAIRSLAAEGWLEIQTHVGAVVASAGAEQLLEIYALRGHIGALAIELGWPSYSAEKLAAIDANIEASEAAVAAKDVPAYTQLNHDFHVLLCDTPQTQWCLRLLANLTAVSFGFAILPDRMAASLVEHRAIRDAIRTGDVATAARLVKQHEQAAHRALASGLDEIEHRQTPEKAAG